MTLDQLLSSLITLLTRSGTNRVSGSDILTAMQNVVNFFSTQIASIIPDWTDALTFNTDGTGAGKFAKYADTNGKKRIFETKTDGNINHTPPTDPSITENTYWIEVSSSQSAAIPEWQAGVYGPGVVIVYHNHSAEGRGLYMLINPDRPFTSSNIETETFDGDWQRIGGDVTRDSEREPTTELVFNANIIQMGKIVQGDGPINFNVPESGHLQNQESVIETEVESNGIDPINFTGVSYFNSIDNGEVLDEGTYQFWFVRMMNGTVTVSIVRNSLETSGLTLLPKPTNFVAVPGTDPDTELNLSWDPVANASGFALYRALSPSGPWGSPIATLPSSTHSYTDSGRSPSTTYYYQNKALGDGSSFNDSQFATTAGATQDAGDTTPPTIESSVANSATDQPVNRLIIYTASEPIMDADGETEVTNDNIANYVSAVNGSAAPQDFTATIDVAKKQITIAPNVAWDPNEDITVTLDGIGDLNGNALEDPFSITFSTSNYTEMIGNHLSLGTQVDSYISGEGKKYKMEFEFKDIVLSGERGLTQKHNPSGVQVSHAWRTFDDISVGYKFYRREPGGGGVVGFSAREVVFPDALEGVTSGKLALAYDGTQDGNNGLDRVKLFLDDEEITEGKSVIATDGSSIWPWAQSGGTAPFQLRGPTFRHVRNFKLYDGDGNVIVNIPIVRTGEDISGNGFNATWI